MKNDRLEEMRKEINSFCEDRDWNQFHDPKNMALSLNLESSEVLELFQWTKNNELQEGKKRNLSEELADVLYWVIKMYDHYDIDILKSFKDKMKQNSEKYPVDKFKGKSGKYNEVK